MTDNKTAQEWGDEVEAVTKGIEKLLKISPYDCFTFRVCLTDLKHAIRMQLLAERGLINETNKEDGTE